MHQLISRKWTSVAYHPRVVVSLAVMRPPSLTASGSDMEIPAKTNSKPPTVRVTALKDRANDADSPWMRQEGFSTEIDGPILIARGRNRTSMMRTWSALKLGTLAYLEVPMVSYLPSTRHRQPCERNWWDWRCWNVRGSEPQNKIFRQDAPVGANLLNIYRRLMKIDDRKFETLQCCKGAACTPRLVEIVGGNELEAITTMTPNNLTFAETRTSVK